MAGKGTSKPSPGRADAGKSPTPPPPRRRLPLNTAGDVRRELARLYREFHSKARDVSDASRLANMLQIMGRVIETSDLEKRLAAIEASQANERTR